MKNKYLSFYNTNFTNGKYCTKSWGFSAYEQGAASRQAEVDELLLVGNNLLDLIQELCCERDELQNKIGDLEQNKRCAQNLVNDLSIAKSKLNQIAIQAQKELETFGSALRFKDAVQSILELKNY